MQQKYKKIDKTFDVAAQKRVVQFLGENSVLDNKYITRVIKLTKFQILDCNSYPIHQAFNLRITVHCKSDKICEKYYKLANQVRQIDSPYIQQYYDVVLWKQNPAFKFIIQAQKYRCNIAQVLFEYKIKKQKLTVEQLGFFIYHILQILKYLIYLYESRKQSFDPKLYKICPQNLGINSQFRIILLNPSINNIQKYAPINDAYKQLLSDCSYCLFEILNIASEQSETEKQLLNFIQKSLSSKKVDLKQDKKSINQFSNKYFNNRIITQKCMNFIMRHVLVRSNQFTEQNPLLKIYSIQQQSIKKKIYNYFQNKINQN